MNIYASLKIKSSSFRVTGHFKYQSNAISNLHKKYSYHTKQKQAKSDFQIGLKKEGDLTSAINLMHFFGI